MDTSGHDATAAWQDKLELAELLAELSSAVDRGDRARIEACYAEDSTDDHGVFKGSGRGFAEFVCGPGALDAMHHQLGQSVFELDGDEAWGETFFTFHGSVRGFALEGFGRYVDYFRRIGGRWKVSYRRVVPDKVPDGDDLSRYWRSTRDREDPSYDRRRGPD